MDNAAINAGERLPASKLSGWKVLGVFAITFIAGWVAGAAVGLTTRQIGLWLSLRGGAPRIGEQMDGPRPLARTDH